jgi:hypothetical protein
VLRIRSFRTRIILPHPDTKFPHVNGPKTHLSHGIFEGTLIPSRSAYTYEIQYSTRYTYEVSLHGTRKRHAAHLLGTPTLTKVGLHLGGTSKPTNYLRPSVQSTTTPSKYNNIYEVHLSVQMRYTWHNYTYTPARYIDTYEDIHNYEVLCTATPS